MTSYQQLETQLHDLLTQHLHLIHQHYPNHGTPPASPIILNTVIAFTWQEADPDHPNTQAATWIAGDSHIEQYGLAQTLLDTIRYHIAETGHQHTDE